MNKPTEMKPVAWRIKWENEEWICTMTQSDFSLACQNHWPIFPLFETSEQNKLTVGMVNGFYLAALDNIRKYNTLPTNAVLIDKDKLREVLEVAESYERYVQQHLAESKNHKDHEAVMECQNRLANAYAAITLIQEALSDETK